MKNALATRPQMDIQDTKELQTLALEFISKAKAENTLDAYASDWADFEAWAGARSLATRPALPQTVVLYISALAKAGSKVSTIQRRLVAISQNHKGAGYDSPTQAQIVRTTMQGIRRSLGVAKEGKSPLLTTHIKAWVQTLSGSLVDRRDKALVLVGYAGAFRRSELCALNREDVEVTSQGLVITVRKSKTDQEGEGRKVGIPFGRVIDGQPSATCPVTALLDWLEVGRIDGPLFRRLRRGGIVTPDRLDDKSVNLVIKGLCEAIGLDAVQYGAHSLRAGHITQARGNGADEQVTMRQSGHKSLEVFRQYVRDSGLFTRNSAQALDL